MSIRLESPSFDAGGVIPDRCARLGGNISPALAWSGVPTGAVELAVLVEDPDAPSGIFTHWVLAGLAPEREGLAEGEVPSRAVEGVNDFGDDGYDGPQPPIGDPPHRYVFTLLALDTPTKLISGASAEELQEATQGAVLAQGELVGRYAR